MKKVTGLHVDSDDVIGREGGFLAIRRMRLRNCYEDGGLSEPYLCDFVVRPMGLDAVVVAVYRREGDQVMVLLRDGLRPALTFGRDPSRTPIAEDRDYLYLTELVAGVVEGHDKGEDGVMRRAAEEVHEEAGYRVDPSAIVMLGAAVFPSAGAMPERFYLTAVEVAADAGQEPLAGDGSPMEEGATTKWMELGKAIAACVAGEIEDAKTELGLRRLREMLGTRKPSP